MQQSEETATETKSQCQRTLGLECERSIVQLQLFERCTQVLVLIRLDGIDTRKDHRLDVLETGNSLLARAGNVGNRIAHLHVGRGLDTRNNVAHVACTDLIAGVHFEFEHTDLVGVVLATRIEELHVVALAQLTVENSKVGNNTTE